MVKEKYVPITIHYFGNKVAAAHMMHGEDGSSTISDIHPCSPCNKLGSISHMLLLVETFLLYNSSLPVILRSYIQRGITIVDCNGSMFVVDPSNPLIRSASKEGVLRAPCLSKVSTGYTKPGEGFHFFYKTGNVFSQWHPMKFEADGRAYNCMEQYMMHKKALLFGDGDSATRIMTATVPRVQKALGRGVVGFKKEVWDYVAINIVYAGNKAKFMQNEDACAALRKTKGKTLVEASPTDKIWGIGLSKDHVHANNIIEWRGTNLLGITLTKLRWDVFGS